MRHCIFLFLTATVMLLACAAPAEAGRFFCHHCGCCQNCKKVCHLKCEKKKETKVEYTCECEDFCVPGPSKKCGVKKEHDCEGHHRTILWQPTCARVHTRKKLVKKEVTKEVPDYKWVVEEYCCVCGHWVKVERDKDKKDKDKKDKEGESDKAGKREANSKKSGKSKGGSSEKEKTDAAQSDRPPSPSDKGGSKNGGTDGDDSAGPNLERLPLPSPEGGDRQTLRTMPAERYRAYYQDTEVEARREASAMAEVPLDEPEAGRPASPVDGGTTGTVILREPRRLFFGRFGR